MFSANLKMVTYTMSEINIYCSLLVSILYDSKTRYLDIAGCQNRPQGLKWMLASLKLSDIKNRQCYSVHRGYIFHTGWRIEA